MARNYRIRERRRFYVTYKESGDVKVKWRGRRRRSGLGIPAALLAAQGEIRAQIEAELERRAVPASQEIVNAAAKVLGKRGKGRRYRIPGTRRHYRASLEKEPPARRTGALAGSWYPKPVKYKRYSEGITLTKPTAQTEMDWLAKLMTKGAVRRRGGVLKHRPFKRRSKQMAMPKICRIYRQPYLQGQGG